VITASLGDKDPDCRIEAIQGLSMSENRDFKYVLKLVHHDMDLQVQKEAIQRLADDMPFHMIQTKERIDFLDRIITHGDERIRRMLGVVLHEWTAQAYLVQTKNEAASLEDFCAGSLFLLKSLSILENDQTVESTLFGIFDNLLKGLHDEYGDDAILELVKAMSEKEHANLNRANFSKFLSMKYF